MTWEADPRHSAIISKQLGFDEKSRGVTTPGDKGNDKIKDEPLDPEKGKWYRSITQRCMYLANDRPDIQFATKEASKYMAYPTEGNWLLMRRLGRDLKGSPRLVQLFRWQHSNLLKHRCFLQHEGWSDHAQALRS